MIYALLLLDFPGHAGWGGPPPGADHFHSFFFSPAIFWLLLLGCIFLRKDLSQPPVAPSAAHPADPSADQPLWPNLDPAPTLRRLRPQRQNRVLLTFP
ncbi:MAG: hypothetical protein U0841_21315 [Chloroflexia bacterium]